MTIIASDPHPGRCQNHRTRIVNGYPETVRCLNYEATPHICTFPPVKVPRAHGGWSDTTQVYTSEKPKPWVAPVTREDEQ